MPNGYTGPGVTNCHDCAWGTETRPAGTMMGPDGLRHRPSVRSIDTYDNPMDSRGRYRPGDRLVTGDGHSGCVNRQRGIGIAGGLPGGRG